MAPGRGLNERVPSGHLATTLDLEWFEKRGIRIHSPARGSDEMLPDRSGDEVAHELGDRYLIHYITSANARTNSYQHGRQGEEVFVGITPYAPEETVRYLRLPGAHLPRRFAVLLDPRKISVVRGPQFVARGNGIQYRLPQGFAEDAIFVPGAPAGHWFVTVD